MKSILGLVFGGFAVAASLFSTSVASADYVCGVRQIPTNSTLGSAGYVYASVYTGPDCTGSLVSNYYLCTTGATSSNCASSSNYRYTELSLQGQFHALRTAAWENRPLAVVTSSCNVSGTGCLLYIHYSAD